MNNTYFEADSCTATQPKGSQSDSRRLCRVFKFARIKILLLILLTSCFCSTQVHSASTKDYLPSRPIPERLVNNLSTEFPNLLSAEEEQSLENKLVEFNKTSSNQIAIVILDSLQGREVNEFSTALFNKWGIGQKKNNNGILILIKPTTDEGGRKIYITTGYGLESVVPDISCKLIIERDIAPSFKLGNYYAGLDKATTSLIELSQKEFNSPISPQKHFALWLFLIFAGAIGIMLIAEFLLPKKNSYTISKRGYKNYPSSFFWLPFGGGSSSSSGSGLWGGGGGFGGFGGGLSGGGGAGGSW